MTKPQEVKIICPQCNGTGRWCNTKNVYPDGRFEIKKVFCEGKGYILAQLWTEQNETKRARFDQMRKEKYTKNNEVNKTWTQNNS